VVSGFERAKQFPDRDAGVGAARRESRLVDFLAIFFQTTDDGAKKTLPGEARQR
jgi:hypothetical protein